MTLAGALLELESFCVGNKKEIKLVDWIEQSTASLQMKCSTTELNKLKDISVLFTQIYIYKSKNSKLLLIDKKYIVQEKSCRIR